MFKREIGFVFDCEIEQNWFYNLYISLSVVVRLSLPLRV